MLRELQGVTFVPTGAIDNHHDVFIGIAPSDLTEKKLHAPTTDLGQDQRVQLPVLRGYRGIGKVY